MKGALRQVGDVGGAGGGAGVTIVQHLRFQRETKRAQEADVQAVWRVREQAMAEFVHKRDLMIQWIAEAVRATTLCAEHNKRNLVRVKLEKQACEV